MDGCDSFVIEVDGMSFELNKSEVAIIMLTETEYTKATKVINNLRRTIRKRNRWTDVSTGVRGLRDVRCAA